MNGPLKLNDLLNLTDEQIKNTRIRLNRNNGSEDPIEIFKKNPDELLEWNYWNSKPYKKDQISIGFVDMGNDTWLLFTIGLIKEELNELEFDTGVDVKYETLEEYKDLYGRVVVSYHNDVQQLFRKGESFLDTLIIKEILPSFYTGFDFPGYDKVCLSFSQLETIINGNYPSFKNALENQKAVYVQTDKATGKLYIGSATSEKGMLLKRWSDYVRTGHGGDVELRNLINEKGFEYIKENFQYSILENFNSNVGDPYIRGRESYWKEVFQSRIFGYNAN